MQKFLKSWGLLIGAVLVGVLAFFAATQYLSNVEEDLKRSLAGQSGEMMDVVVAAFDIPAGESVNIENLAVAQMSTANLSGAVITPDLFDSIDGSMLKVDMVGGEPLLSHFLEGVLIERFSELLKKGQRAVTIEVDALLSNAGLLSVGDHVDIFLQGSFPVPGAEGAGDSETLVPLFQNIRVLAIDRNPLLTREQPFRPQNFIPDENGNNTDEEVYSYSAVTLALQAGDADNLAFASTIGDIMFLLRAADDNLQQTWEKLDEESILEALAPEKTSRSYAFFGKTSTALGSLVPQVRETLTLTDQLNTPSSNRRFMKSIPTPQNRDGQAEAKQMVPSDSVPQESEGQAAQEQSAEEQNVNESENTEVDDTSMNVEETNSQDKQQ